MNRSTRRAPRPTILATLAAICALVLSGPSPAEPWPEAAPTDQGLDPARLEEGIDHLGALQGVRSVLVTRRGSIVAERSFGGSDANGDPHNIKSASKSLLSALVGIAFERCEISGPEATLAELLPEYARDLPAEKARITLDDLLTMRSGLRSTSGPQYGPWVATKDWVAGALTQPLVAPPGTEFTYSTGNTHLVSAILTEACGKSTLELAREWLVGPIGGRIASWERSPEGYYLGGNNLSITPRDLARLGQLYLQGGRWDGRQVVPADWVTESTREHAEGWPERYGAYGYFWWLPPDDPWASFAAIGYGGQLLYVVPELEMVVVVTSTLESKGEEWDGEVFRVLREGVFGAVRPEGGGSTGK